MFARCIRIAAVSGMLVALMPASKGQAASPGDDLGGALAAAEQRGREAQLAEPAYPSQAASTGLPYRYTGTGRPETIKVAPVTLAQAETAPALEPGPVDRTAVREQQAETPVFSIKEDLWSAPRWLWEDTKLVYTSPLNLGLLLAAGGASIAVHQHVDWTFNDKFMESRTCKQGWGDAANATGYPPLHLAIAGVWYLAGYEFKDLKTYNVGKNLLSALIITDLSTVMLKACAADTEGPQGQHFSWPSGHTSSSFALAAVLNESYGPLVGVPMYAFAGWVGFERMDDHQHMFSDVLFGAVLGTVIGETVARGHLPQIAGGTVLPYADPENRSGGFAWIKTSK